MYWYLEVLRKYAVFEGRARRTEYWMFTLISVIISFLLGLIEGIFGIAPELDFSVLSSIYSLGIFIPALAVSVRRLHDIGRSGWWFLIIFIPIIGFLILLVLAMIDSERGPNRYGADPKESRIRV